MGTGYTRNDTADNIADGNIINASDLDGEFDALQSAFDNSSGHTHDGTAGEGAPVEKVGPNQEVVVTATVLRPAANNTIDLGVETTNEFKDLWLDGTAYLDAVDIDGGTIDGLSILTVDNLSLNGNTITSTDTNGNLNLRANGTGIISVDATDVNFGDSDKATFGDDSDLSITHNGTNSIITDSGTGNLLLRGSNVSIQNAAGDETVAQFVEDSFVKLYHDNSEVFSTTSTGISVTGDVDASDDLILSSDGSKITFGADGDVEITHSHNVGLIFDNTNTSDDQDFVLTLRSNEDTILADEQIARINFSTNSSAGGQAAGTQASIKVDATDTYSATVAGSRMEFHTTTGSGTNTRAMYIDDDQSVVFTGPSANVKLDATNSTLDFPDNFKIMMGASDDLSIYHDGSNSFISDQGTGNLKILADDFRIRNATDTDSYIFVNSGAEVGLTYNGATKLATTATGIDVTGTITSDGLTVDTNTLHVDSTNNRVGVGTVSPQSQIAVSNAATTDVMEFDTAPGFSRFMSIDRTTGDEKYLQIRAKSIGFALDSGADDVTIDSSGNVGIGTTADQQSSAVNEGIWFSSGSNSSFSANSTPLIINRMGTGGNDRANITLRNNGTARADIGTLGASNGMYVAVGGSEAMRIDASGNLLVGKTSSSLATDGIEAKANGSLFVTRSSATPVSFRRSTTDGDIVNFYKDGTSVGSIGVETIGGTGYPFICNTKSGNAGLHFAGRIQPTDHTGDRSDNTVDLGFSSFRFDDIYATNGTIQTSDRNEKQDIAELSDAEQRVAVAAKGLMRKFRWRDAVEAKGDEARTHFGIIAQDLQAAFAAEGLDAGDYAMFISSTWTDEETGEERTRMGVRYSELLAFIIAAI